MHGLQYKTRHNSRFFVIRDGGSTKVWVGKLIFIYPHPAHPLPPTLLIYLPVMDYNSLFVIWNPLSNNNVISLLIKNKFSLLNLYTFVCYLATTLSCINPSYLLKKIFLIIMHIFFSVKDNLVGRQRNGISICHL